MVYIWPVQIPAAYGFTAELIMLRIKTRIRQCLFMTSQTPSGIGQQLFRTKHLTGLPMWTWYTAKTSTQSGSK